MRLAGSVAFVAVGAWTLTLPFNVGRTIAMAAATAFFAWSAIRCAWTLIRPGYLRVSRRGIEIDQGWEKQFWPWMNVVEVSVTKGKTRFASATLVSFKDDQRSVALFNWELPPLELKSLLDEYRQPLRVNGI